jgi:hypothetical protein
VGAGGGGKSSRRARSKQRGASSAEQAAMGPACCGVSACCISRFLSTHLCASECPKGIPLLGVVGRRRQDQMDAKVEGRSVPHLRGAEMLSSTSCLARANRPACCSWSYAVRGTRAWQGGLAAATAASLRHARTHARTPARTRAHMTHLLHVPPHEPCLRALGTPSGNKRGRKANER